MILHVLGFGGTLLAAVFLLPQIVRLRKLGDARGVSTTWALFGLVTNLVWVVYLLNQRLIVATLAPAMAVVTYGLVVVLLFRLGRRSKTGWSLAYALVFVVAYVFGGSPWLGSLLVVTPAVQMAPEVHAVFRQAHPSGVSLSTWLLGALEALCWGGYGHLTGDPALMGYGMVTLLASALILARCGLDRGRAQPLRPSSTTSTNPSRIAVAAASPRLAALSLRKILET